MSPNLFVLCFLFKTLQFPTSPQAMLNSNCVAPGSGGGGGLVGSGGGGSVVAEYNANLNLMQPPRVGASGGGVVPNLPSVSSSSLSTGPTSTSSIVSGSGSSSGGAGLNTLTTKAVQTDLTGARLTETETQANLDSDAKNTKIDELTRSSDDLRHQVATQQRHAEQQKAHINKCIEVRTEIN